MKLLPVILLFLILMVVITEAAKKQKKNRPALKKKPSKPFKKPSRKPSRPSKKRPKKPSKNKPGRKPGGKPKPGRKPGGPKKPGRKPGGPPKPGSAEEAAVLKKLFKPFTANNTGCSCWWDLTRNDCGCCIKKKGGKQCGYPQHQWCYKSKGDAGCPGVKEPRYTMSQKGHPCYWDPVGKSADCAWCAPGGFQCGDTCVGKDQSLNCRGGLTAVQGDCHHIPVCDLNAKCIETKKEAQGVKWSRCICNKGTTANDTFTGNGIQCFNGNGVGGDPNKKVEVEMMLTTDFYVFPHDSSDFPYGPATDNLFSTIDDMFNSGKPCPGCNATVIKLNGSPP